MNDLSRGGRPPGAAGAYFGRYLLSFYFRKICKIPSTMYIRHIETSTSPLALGHSPCTSMGLQSPMDRPTAEINNIRGPKQLVALKQTLPALSLSQKKNNTLHDQLDKRPM